MERIKPRIITGITIGLLALIAAGCGPIKQGALEAGAQRLIEEVWERPIKYNKHVPTGYQKDLATDYQHELV